MFKKITDAETAKKLAKEGAIGSVFIAIITAIAVVISINGTDIYGMDYWAFFDVAIFIIIGLGIYKMSRIAAVLGFIFYVAEQVNMMASYGTRPSFLMIVFVITYINAIRGTFAYHKYEKQQSMPVE